MKLYEEYLGKDSTFYTIQGQIAIVLQRLKRYCEAEKVYLDLLNYAEKTQNYRLLQLFSNNLSVVYLELNQPEDALKHLKTALRLAREIGGITLAEALRNCARAYGLLNEDRKEYSSLKVLQPSLLPLTMILISTLGHFSAAISACSAVFPSAVQTIALTPATLKRYSKSWSFNWLVAGITIAPSLCNARIENQNW